MISGYTLSLGVALMVERAKIIEKLLTKKKMKQNSGETQNGTKMDCITSRDNLYARSRD